MTTKLLTTNDSIVKYAETALNHDISAIASASPPPDTDEIFNCSDIPKYSELHLNTPIPHRMCMIKDLSPRLHLIGRPHGAYTEVLKHALVDKGSVVFDFPDGNYLHFEDITESNMPPKSYPDCKIVELNGSLIKVTMRGGYFYIIDTRAIDDVALEITISQEGRLPGKFLFKALVVISDQLQDIALGAAPWNNNMLVDMMKHLKKYCSTMGNATFTSIEVGNEAIVWQMSDLMRESVDLIGIVSGNYFFEYKVSATEINNKKQSAKISIISRDLDEVVMTYETRLINRDIRACAIDHFKCTDVTSDQYIYLTFQLKDMSFITEIFFPKKFKPFMEVLPIWKSDSMVVLKILQTFERGLREFILIIKLK